jgi:ATP-dependent RNA circularization protein (DNA/RNA ligase family)
MCEQNMMRKWGRVREHFIKFPSTPHLALLGNTKIRNDKVMSNEERETFLKHRLVVEEKVDGSNMGISFDVAANIKIQSRGSYLHSPYSGQWKKLEEWLKPKSDNFFDFLGDRFILFGEWCFALHSVFYNKLPDWFLGFDIFDREHRKFFSVQRRDVFFEKMNIIPVPRLKMGFFSITELQNLFSSSHLADMPAEGLYLRLDHDAWLEQRAKLVRSEFIQSIGRHWLKSGIKKNQLRCEQTV